jgi:hypothetical protein
MEKSELNLKILFLLAEFLDMMIISNNHNIREILIKQGISNY